MLRKYVNGLYIDMTAEEAERLMPTINEELHTEMTMEQRLESLEKQVADLTPKEEYWGETEDPNYFA